MLRPLENNGRIASRRESSALSATIKRYIAGLLPRLQIYGPGHEKETQTKHGGKVALPEGVKLLTEAAKYNNSDAMMILADMNFFGNFTCPRDMNEAFYRYSELAALSGNSSAHHMLGFMYATGIGAATQRDPAKALLHHTFAARAGHTRSEMTLAYRYHSGVGAAINCEQSVQYYKRVADKAIEWYRTGPPGGRRWTSRWFRLADDNGGVYGEGASVASAGHNAKHRGGGLEGSVEDMIEYLDMMSEKGEFKAALQLGQVYYEGQRGVEQNFALARKYFLSVARQYWGKDGTVLDIKNNPMVEKYAARAAGLIGRLYLRGEGVKTDYDKAVQWYRRGITAGDSGSQFGLGLMYLHGLGVSKDVSKASDLLGEAAMQNQPLAQVQLAHLYLDQGETEDVIIAHRYFELASRNGNIEAQYYLGEMANFGTVEKRSCATAVSFYKSVVEKAASFVSTLNDASEAYENGDRELALVEFMMAAEQGYEVGQVNAAYLLDRQKAMIKLPTIPANNHQKWTLLDNDALALLYWTRSAKQNNIDSLVKMGDYYLDGIGTSQDWEKAATCYSAAADFSQSAQALYNLGWMHENGIGLTQDFHLAKRNYDQALLTNTEAYFPVKLSLFKLRLRSAWNTLTHGRVNSIRDEPGEIFRQLHSRVSANCVGEAKKWSLSEWIANFLEEEKQYYESDDKYQDLGVASTGDDLYDELTLEDGVLEMFLIIALVASILYLVYYRQQRLFAQAPNNGAVANQEGNPGPPVPPAAVPNNGLFPQPGDPAFPDWVAGGIGH